MRVVAVIAAYNERDNIEQLTRRLVAVLQTLRGWDWEVIYIVDGVDGTKEIVERLSTDLRHIQLLYQAEPDGLSNAFRRGFARLPPDSDFVLTMDADLNHQPEEIPRLLLKMTETGSDILVGSRFVRGSR